MAQHPPGGPYPPYPGYGAPPAQYPVQQQPQHGFAQQPYPQPQLQAPPPGLAHGQRAVFGAPLGPDERVIYYRRIERGVVGTIITGVILMPFLFAGIFLFVRAAKMRTAESHANVVTNRRIFTVNGDGRVLQELPWPDVAGMTYFKRRRGLNTVVVRGRSNREVMFDEWIDEIHAFIQRVADNLRAIDSLPEARHDVACLPPKKPGQRPLVAGLVTAVLGVLTIAFAFAAVNESEIPVVAGVGGLGILVGGILSVVGLVGVLGSKR